MRFAVCVTFRIKPGQIDSFMPPMIENARTSLSTEPGCHRFDVATDDHRPDEVFLYELYDDPDAFQTHLDSAHFKAFDAATQAMIANKDVRTYSLVHT